MSVPEACQKDKHMPIGGIPQIIFARYGRPQSTNMQRVRSNTTFLLTAQPLHKRKHRKKTPVAICAKSNIWYPPLPSIYPCARHCATNFPAIQYTGKKALGFQMYLCKQNCKKSIYFSPCT